jgi:protein-tyrosine sulfotransferase
MRKILTFLNLPWDESVLHHQDFINKAGGISLSKLEKSSDQVKMPVNLDGLSKWVGNIPEDVLKDMKDIAPMLAFLGYDPEASQPDYNRSENFEKIDK